MLRRKNGGKRYSFKYQRGMTLIELLVAGVISIIASSGMILLMANTLGSGSQAIQMARVTQEMRAAMQIMSRELRRANYHPSFMTCYGDVDCLTTLGLAAKVGNVGISDNGNSDCLWFWYDRPQTGTAVALTAEPVAAFRRTTEGTVGKLQITTTLVGTPNCNADANWFDITDPDVVDILTFNIDEANSFSEVINADGDTQNVERVELTLTAKLVSDPFYWVGMPVANSQRELRTFVKVRNNTTAKFVAPTP